MTEPESYSWDDLVNDDVSEWDGVRNFQARAYLRDEISE
jgi:predicted RNA-binding protein with PUA-like domain